LNARWNLQRAFLFNFFAIKNIINFMEQDLENFLRDAFKQKEVAHYLSTLQKIKVFIESRLADSSGKNEEERLKDYYTTLASVRDLAATELVSYTMSENIQNVVAEFQKRKEIEESDQQTFQELSEEDPKKNSN